MKLAPVNGINVKVCELMFVPETEVFSICVNFQSIHQIGGLQ